MVPPGQRAIGGADLPGRGAAAQSQDLIRIAKLRHPETVDLGRPAGIIIGLSLPTPVVASVAQHRGP